MPTSAWIIFGIYIITMIAYLGITYRAVKVRNFMFDLIDKISDLTSEDMKGKTAYDNWDWRYKKYEEVSYATILYTFWKKITPENYYKDLTFLK